MFKHRTSRIMREHTHTYAHPSRRLHKHPHKHKPKATSTPNAVLKAPSVTRERGGQCVPRSMEFWFGLMLEHGLFVTSFLPVRTFASLWPTPRTAPRLHMGCALMEKRKSMGAFQRGRTPVARGYAFPDARAPVPKYILSPRYVFLRSFFRPRY